ncbi:hypothetical protein D1614_10545 [Maribellus luteus]|uniref:Uncharacterized protein n=1 Tax=Maribellus luteus TaxID=2305463 RepID=A0A399SVV5_9BACT|nr:hypothetical protein D1614_10545 [Maribellus luteus]
MSCEYNNTASPQYGITATPLLPHPLRHPGGDATEFLVPLENGDKEKLRAVLNCKTVKWLNCKEHGAQL